MSRTRRAARIGLPLIFAAMALGVPAVAAAAPPPNHPTFRSDFIVGDEDANTLFGRAGADLIFGLGGDDTLYGNLGADRLFGGLGADTLYGGLGADTLRGGQGSDIMRGGPGNDLILAAGDDAIDTVDCGRGGADVAIVDPTDVVSRDCEYIWVRDPGV